MDRIFTYCVPLPTSVSEVVTPCAEGYTVYLADRLSRPERKKAFMHALSHIVNDDFNSPFYADEIEGIRHVDPESA